MLSETICYEWCQHNSVSVGVEKVELPSDIKTHQFKIDDHVFMLQTQGAPSGDDLNISAKTDRVILIYVAAEHQSSSRIISESELKVGMGELILVRGNVEPKMPSIDNAATVISIVVSSGYIEQLFCKKCSNLLLGTSGNTRKSLKFTFRPQIAAALHQLIGAQLREELCLLFARAKTYELLSLTLDQLCTDSNHCSLSKSDIERLHKARVLLETNLVSPPSLIDLAHKVGINDFKLKKGFKELFQMTPYSYLRQRRMIAAREALVGSDMSVTEVANEVGYSNLGHFAAAFRKQFGVKPKDFKRRGFAAALQTNSASG